MTNFKKISLCLVVATTFGLSGCGGGGGGSTTSIDDTQTGIFVDSPVNGLKYESKSFSGYTNNGGIFQYKNGETITFKLGNLVLGQTKGSPYVTPLDISGDDNTNLDDISVKATNIARLLQTIDNNSSDGIQLNIPSSLNDLNISNYDIESEADLNTILTKVQEKTMNTYLLKDSQSSKENMKNYISIYKMYPTFNTNYTYTKTGTSTYLLILKNSQVISYSFQYVTPLTSKEELAIRFGNTKFLHSFTMYDINRKTIDYNPNKLYSAGTYIINVNYSSNPSTFSLDLF